MTTLQIVSFQGIHTHFRIKVMKPHDQQKHSVITILSSEQIFPNNEDNTTNSVITYNFTGRSASTLMGYDVKALQYLYGAKSLNSNNTTYSFSTVYGFSDGVKSWGSVSSRTSVSIWVSAGIDTLDFYNLAANASGYRFDLQKGGIITTQDTNNNILIKQ